MINNLLACLILAASPLFAAGVETNDCISKSSRLTHYGYFYLIDSQTLDGVTEGIYDAVNWSTSTAVETKHISLDSENLSDILIHDKGVYTATFSVLASNDSDNDNFSFGLLLNGVLLPGSIYGAFTSDEEEIVQLIGQVIFEVTESHSVIQLVNNTADDVVLETINGGGTDNVTASVLIEKINKL